MKSETRKRISVSTLVTILGVALTIVGIVKLNPFFAAFGAGVLTKGICMLIDGK